MVIYADVLFLTNLYIDFFLLACVKQFLHLRASRIRLLLGALTGAICSLAALLPALPPLLSLGMSIACALLISVVAFRPLSTAMRIKSTAAYWAFSFLFAGAFLLFYRFTSPGNLAVRNGMIYLPLSPALLFSFTLVAYLLILLVRRLLGPQEPDIRFCRIKLTYAEYRCTLDAKADTGHNLREPFSGLPVIVVEASVFGDRLPKGVLSYFETGIPEDGIRLIPFESIGGKGVLPAFRPQSCCFLPSGISFDCYIAICSRKLSSGQFNALFSPELLALQDASNSAEQKAKKANNRLSLHRLTQTDTQKTQGRKGNIICKETE